MSDNSNNRPPAKESMEDEEFAKDMNEIIQYNTLTDDELEGWSIDNARAKLRVESASRGPPARVTFRFLVTQQMANRNKVMHGGCIATVIDVFTSMVAIGVSSQGMFQYSGVSRNLNVTYLRPVPVGQEVRVICELVQMGKRLATLRAEIRRVDNDQLCVLADHHKVNTDPQPSTKL